MWYEYPIQTNMDDQKRIIRQLRKWILDLESRGLIQGFAFNHYSHEPPELPALNVRFDCTDDKLATIRKELDQEVKKLLSSYVLQERLWDNGQSPEQVYKAYEFGSRCAFLFWDLIEKGRFPEEFAGNYLQWTSATTFNLNTAVFTFQSCFAHGVMNSLSVSKTPNEQWIHLASLIESTKASNPQELCAWIQSQPALFFPKKPEPQNEKSR